MSPHRYYDEGDSFSLISWICTLFSLEDCTWIVVFVPVCTVHSGLSPFVESAVGILDALLLHRILEVVWYHDAMRILTFL